MHESSAINSQGKKLGQPKMLREPFDIRCVCVCVSWSQQIAQNTHSSLSFLFECEKIWATRVAQLNLFETEMNIYIHIGFSDESTLQRAMRIRNGTVRKWRNYLSKKCIEQLTVGAATIFSHLNFVKHCRAKTVEWTNTKKNRKWNKIIIKKKCCIRSTSHQYGNDH